MSKFNVHHFIIYATVCFLFGFLTRPSIARTENQISTLLSDFTAVKDKCEHNILLNEIEHYSSQTPQKGCPSQFDGLLCWPRTPPGHVTSQQCPHQFYKTGNATRRCLPNGIWQFQTSEPNLIIRGKWANYSACVAHSDKSHAELKSVLQKIEITKVTQETQFSKLVLAKALCNIAIAEYTKSNLQNSNETCPPAFDDIMCWPATKKNTEIRTSCAYYVNDFNTSQYAIRQCMPNATWFVPPGKGSLEMFLDGWTNFTQCSITQETGNKKLLMFHAAKINLIGDIGYGISLIFLATATAILAGVRRLHCQRNNIHINLFLAFLAKAVCHFINKSVQTEVPNVACKLLQTLMTYGVFTTFMWIFAEALHLYVLIFISAMTNKHISIWIYMCIGWGVPFIFTGIWVLLRIFLYDHKCWNAYEPLGADIFLINIYLSLLTFANAGLFIRIVKELFMKMQTQPHDTDSSSSNKYRKLAKSTFVLVFVFGIYYIIFLPLSMIPKDKLGYTLDIIKLYYEHFFTSFQGFFVALLFCFNNTEVHKETKRLILLTIVGKWLMKQNCLSPIQEDFETVPRSSRKNRRTLKEMPPSDNCEMIPLAKDPEKQQLPC